MKKNKLVTGLLAGAVLICTGTALFCNKKIEGIEAEYGAAKTAYTEMTEKYAPKLINKTPPGENREAMENEVPEEPETEAEPVIDFEGLNAKCKFGSVAGWLYCEGTQINYPIMQCDDNSYYLHKLIDGTYNNSGSLYTDFRCAEDFRGTNTVIYGHNMASGAMFGELKNYVNDEKFFEDHPSMTLYTPNGDYLVEIFSSFKTETSNELIWQFEFENDADYTDYLSYLIQQNKIPSGPNINVTPADKIVTLITCGAGTENTRTLVLGKLTEIS